MKTALVALASVALSACINDAFMVKPIGAIPDEHLCFINGLRIEAAFTFDCRVMAENIYLVQGILAREKIVTFDEIAPSFVPTFGDTFIHMVDGAEFAIDRQSPEDYKASGISVGVDNRALLHEMLHDIDRQRGGILTSFHFQWEERGWVGMDAEFASKAKNPVLQ